MVLTDGMLMSLFNIGPEDRDEKIRIERALSECAEKEYADFLKGTFPSSSMSVFMAYRLSLLVEKVFEGLIPSEDHVAAIFHITIERARSVIRTMLANYAEALEKNKRKTFKAILTQNRIGQPDNNGLYIVPIRSSATVGMMNQVLGLLYPGSARIRPRPGIAGQYLIAAATRDLLLAYAGDNQEGGVHG